MKDECKMNAIRMAVQKADTCPLDVRFTHH